MPDTSGPAIIEGRVPEVRRPGPVLLVHSEVECIRGRPIG